MGISVFNGVSQGSQPLFSEHYGKGDKDGIKILRRLSIITSLLFSAIMILSVFLVFLCKVSCEAAGSEALGEAQ